jgi:hypothetical protein
METEGSLPCLQVPATGPCFEPAEFSQQPHILLLKDPLLTHFKISLSLFYKSCTPATFLKFL